MSVELCELTLSATADLMASGELAATELLASVLSRIEAVDGAIGSFTYLMLDSATAAARAADAAFARGEYRGPLHGIPITLKDLYDVAGVPTLAGSAVRAAHVAAEHSTVAARLIAANAVLLGKVRTHEFGLGYTTPGTRNPWQPDHISGGSSGGSAAAVAARMCFASMGTDTGGSIRVPASLCGVVGLKPTFGLVPMRGIVPLSSTMDNAGPIARTVADLAAVLDVVAGYDPQDATSVDRPVSGYRKELDRGVGGLKLGVPGNLFFNGCQPEVETAVRQAIDQLAALGAELVELTMPSMDGLHAAHNTILAAEAGVYHRDLVATAGDKYGEENLEGLRYGMSVSMAEYVEARQYQVRVRHEWLRAFKEIDALVAPSVSGPAPRIGQETVELPGGGSEPSELGFMRTSYPAAFTGFPALTVPCGFTGAGLPIGLQLIGSPFTEARLLSIGHAYQLSTQWHTVGPSLGRSADFAGAAG